MTLPLLAPLLGMWPAALVASPPEGAAEVGVLLCAVDDCSDRMFWVSHEPSLEKLPIVVVDTLLAEDAATVAQGEELAAGFRAALAAARLAANEGRWRDVEFRLDDAEGRLARWRGTASNQELFELAFLRGAARVGAGEGSGEAAFRQAAAVAWNRSVAEPVQDPKVLDAWSAALYDAIREPPAAIWVSPGSADPVYTLDGVPVGSAPLRLDVFAGVHRLTAVDERTGMVWTASVSVTAGGNARVTARFPGGSDPAWVAGELMASVSTHRMGNEVADLLAAWAGRHQLSRLRLLRLDPVAPAAPVGEDPAALGAAPALTPIFTLSSVTWEPLVRRLTVP